MTGPAATDDARDLWLDCPQPNPQARRRLICFPHAGGSAVMFRTWGRNLPDTEVFAVRYPGRAERLAEPPPEHLPALARQIATALALFDDDVPLSLFGHSLGAVVALETARQLEREGRPVAHLFASGSRNAPLPVVGPEDEPGEAEAEDDDPATIARLISLGGTDPGLAADPLFQELVLPYIRSDGRMFHAHQRRFSTLPTLTCPVTTIVGDVDVDADERPWPELTQGRFREVVVPGDHFYLSQSPPFGLLEEEARSGSRQSRE